MLSSRVNKTKSSKSSKPALNSHERRFRLASLLSTEDNVAMVACTNCVNRNVVCYYDREQSVKCAECLRRQCGCDGTFSVEEFRKVSDQKRLIKEQALHKQRELERARKRMIEARAILMKMETEFSLVESEKSSLDEETLRLEETASRMLRREMQALGVVNSLDNEREVALGDSDLAWSEMPMTEEVDWSTMMQDLGGSPAEASGVQDIVAVL